ncbi:hypothetical protein [Burkholderia pyrrocinia]
MLPITDTSQSSQIHSTEPVAVTSTVRDVLNHCETSGIAAPRRGSDVAASNLANALEQARDSHDKAKVLGVDTARRQFVVQALALAAATVGLGAAIAVTVLSAGAGVPLLALAGLAFSLASADTACALYEWRSKAAGGEGLPLAGDSLANVIYAVGKSAHASNEQARKVAGYASMGLRASLTVGTLFTAFFAPSPAVGTVVSALSALVRPTLAEASSASGRGVAFNHEGQQQRLEAERNEELERQAARNDVAKQRYEAMIQSLQDEVDMLKTKIETARRRLARAMSPQDALSVA